MTRIGLLLCLGLVLGVGTARGLRGEEEVNEPRSQAESEAVIEKAVALRGQADTHRKARRFKAAITDYEGAIELFRSLGTDHPEFATAMNNLASTYMRMGEFPDAQRLYEDALAMRKRVFEDDHREVAEGLNNLAAVYMRLARYKDALPLVRESLALARRRQPGDSPLVVKLLGNLGTVLGTLGEYREALPIQEEALEIAERLFEGDDPNVGYCMLYVAATHQALGRDRESLPPRLSALAMFRRLHEGEDHPDVVKALRAVSGSYQDLGRPRDALPLAQEALGVVGRLFEGDHPYVAEAMRQLAQVSVRLGRPSDAWPLFEASLEMNRRVFKGDHPRVAAGISNLAANLKELGRYGDALPLAQEAYEMRKRLHDSDHRDLASSLNNLASLYRELGQHEDALPLRKEVLAMVRRLYEGDHLNVARCLGGLASTYGDLGRQGDALSLEQEALAMLRRLFPNGHSQVAFQLYNLATRLRKLGRQEEAVELAEESIQVGERVRWPSVYAPRVLLGSLTLAQGQYERAIEVLQPATQQLESRRQEARALSGESRAQFVSELRRGIDPFSGLVRALVAVGRTEDALGVLERSRGREMLDLLERGRQGPLEIARERAAGDTELLARIDEVHRSVQEAETEITLATAATARARAARSFKLIREARKAETDAREAHAKALRARFAVIKQALPEGRPLKSGEVQALLKEGERLLTYSFGDVSFAFVVSRDAVTAHRLGTDAQPLSPSALAVSVEAYVKQLAQLDGLANAQGQHPGKAIFDAVVPPAVWKEIRGATRLYVLPQGVLHRLPFEALVSDVQSGKPVYVVDEAPPIAYAASASVLAWLMEKPVGAVEGTHIVAVADPAFSGVATWPEKGVVVTDITPGTQAHKAKLRPGDVITSYDGKATDDFAALIASARSVDPKAEAVKVALDREGVRVDVTFKPGRMGVLLAREAPPLAGPDVIASTRVAGVMRGAGTRGSLAPLPGTRAELAKISAVVRDAKRGGRVTSLLGGDATEAALFESVQAPRILHLATHGLVDPFKRAREAALALTPPRVPTNGNDGFLTLGDLLERWRGRLDGTALVVLSACDSQTGKLDVNEGMFSLPWGFCFAGARSAIASLWKVDDQGTSLLMAELYKRLMQGKVLAPCEALQQARIAIKKVHPQPYYWAPFVLAGAP